jgi:S-formylglutathione hydrolase FrmB
MSAFDLRNVSILGWDWRAGLLAAIALLVVASFRWLGTRPLRWVARAMCLPLALGFAGATVNAHFEYFPTIGALFGRTAADQMSSAALGRLEQLYGRTAHGRRGAPPASAALRRSTVPSHGVVVPLAMPGTVSHYPARPGEVYLPPIWFTSPRPVLPVIELLHGSPGSPADWTRGGRADVTADAFARVHRGYAPILVMPDVNGGGWWNDSECVDGPLGNAETYLTVDVRNAVVRAVGASADGRDWAIAGLSEGGSCALQMGLRHPDLFRVVGDFSGDDHPWVSGGLRRLFWGHTLAQLDAAERGYDPRVLLDGRHGPTAPAIAFAAGSNDGVREKLARLYLVARRDHIDSVFATYPGGHTFGLWRACFQHDLPWIAARLSVRGLAVTPISRPARSPRAVVR